MYVYWVRVRVRVCLCIYSCFSNKGRTHKTLENSNYCHHCVRFFIFIEAVTFRTWLRLNFSFLDSIEFCRFEKLDITPKSAQKIKPVLERWMKEAEERYIINKIVIIIIIIRYSFIRSILFTILFFIHVKNSKRIRELVQLFKYLINRSVFFRLPFSDGMT